MSWLIVFLGFCFLIMIHEAGHFLAAKATGMRVERFFLFFGPTIWSFRRGETEYGVKAIPLGGYVKITGMNPEEDVPPEHEENAYFRKPVWKRIVVVAAGPAVNIVLAFLILFGVYWLQGRPVAEQSVESVERGSPAAKILRPGDRIVAVDGKAFPRLGPNERLQEFGEIVRSRECAGGQSDGCRAAKPVSVRFERNGRVHSVVAFPRYDKEIGYMRLGFQYRTAREAVGAGAAASEAADRIGEVASQTAHIITHLFESRQRKELHGVVGISDVGHQVVETGLEKSLLLLALVSLSLGLVNLLPILPLDGGHILWALVEKLRGRPVSLRVIERATVVGFALVLVLMFIGLSNDVGQLTGEGFNVR
ncbi:MAG TPA: site-2 protease family protein [Solirubrobacterales bacterium]|nr:site-2 protease family protein [Solirubrobacterales bacterium]